MNAKPKLTIGMAHFDDFDGIYMTIQSLKLHHQNTHEVELVVVDTSASGRLKRYLEGKSHYGKDGVRTCVFNNVKYLRAEIGCALTVT